MHRHSTVLREMSIKDYSDRGSWCPQLLVQQLVEWTHRWQYNRLTKNVKTKICKQISDLRLHGKRTMKNANRLLFSAIILASYSFCHAENAKLTAELMNSGFHRLVTVHVPLISVYFIVFYVHWHYYSSQERGVHRRVSGLSGQTKYIPDQTIVTSQYLRGHRSTERFESI